MESVRENFANRSGEGTRDGVLACTVYDYYMTNILYPISGALLNIIGKYKLGRKYDRTLQCGNQIVFIVFCIFLETLFL
jgi:hypothetical protein